MHEQSHGESFLALITKRFGGHGVYILDEPEAALSPQRQLTVLARMHDLVGLDSQIIVATHSPVLMSYPESYIYWCGAEGMKRVKYEETEHYQVTRMFLADRQRMLKVLFAKEDS